MDLWNECPLALGAWLLRITPEDRFDVQPLIEPDLVLVGHIRLDAREELGQTLGLDPKQLAETPDSRLLALAWRRWGADCAEHLYGDWVCAVWDRQRRSLWIGRDAAGNTGLYWWQGGQRVVFSTSLKALLANPAVPHRPNAYTIARQLAVVFDFNEETATHYEGIQRLPGGHALYCDAAGVRLDAWWRPESLPEFRWDSDEEGYAAFRDLYGRTVEDRLRRAGGPVALMLSAGLDSGTVGALAAPRLATGGQPLLGFVAVPRYVPHGAPARRLGDEGPLARAVADHIGNLEYLPVPSDGAGIVESIHRMVDLHDRPGHAAGNQYWIHDILRLAAGRGVRVLLTGQGGNATVSWNGAPLSWSDLGSGGIAVLAEALREPKWPLIKESLVKPLLRPARNTLRRMHRNGTSPWADHSAIHPCLAKETDLYRRMCQAGHDPISIAPTDSRHPRIAHFRLGRLGSASLGSTWMELGTAYGLEVRDPTRDRRLIEFCWRTPNRLFWAGGLQRGLIRKGMAGYLPPEVLHSCNKGLQAADLGYRILAEREPVLDALDRLGRHPLAGAWLDLPKMRGVLDELSKGVTPGNTERAGTILLRGLGVGLFLMRF
jgi:asparagine synthase (glutamine-hydrolysing)